MLSLINHHGNYGRFSIVQSPNFRIRSLSSLLGPQTRITWYRGCKVSVMEVEVAISSVATCRVVYYSASQTLYHRVAILL